VSLRVEAVLFDPATGLETTVTSTAEDRDGAEFYWTEGNMGCDCNRRLEIARARGEPDVEDVACGSAIELRSLKLDGVECLSTARRA